MRPVTSFAHQPHTPAYVTRLAAQPRADRNPSQPANADYTTQGLTVTQPQFGFVSQLVSSEQTVLATLKTIAALLKDPSDDKYWKGNTPPLTVVQRYKMLSPGVKQAYFDNAILTHNIDRRLREGLQGKDAGWVTVAEEFGDVLYMLAEQMLMAEKPFPMELPTLSDEVLAGYRGKFEELFDRKLQGNLRSLPDHFEQELQELFEEAHLDEQQQAKVREFFTKKVITDADVRRLEKLVGLPNLDPNKLMQIEYAKIDAREKLRTEKPEYDYDMRKFLLKPFERLYIAETLVPKTTVEKLTTFIQGALRSLITPFYELFMLAKKSPPVSTSSNTNHATKQQPVHA